MRDSRCLNHQVISETWESIQITASTGLYLTIKGEFGQEEQEREEDREEAWGCTQRGEDRP